MRSVGDTLGHYCIWSVTAVVVVAVVVVVVVVVVGQCTGSYVWNSWLIWERSYGAQRMTCSGITWNRSYGIWCGRVG